MANYFWHTTQFCRSLFCLHLYYNGFMYDKRGYNRFSGYKSRTENSLRAAETEVYYLFLVFWVSKWRLICSVNSTAAL